jgi:hypothetical protein
VQYSLVSLKAGKLYIQPKCFHPWRKGQDVAPAASKLAAGLLIPNYKEEYVKKHKSHDHSIYEGSKAASNLKRWFDEKWTNQRGEIRYKKKSDVYRPTV